MSEIFDIQRFADISNSEHGTVINGTAKSAFISSSGDNVTIYGGADYQNKTFYAK